MANDLNAKRVTVMGLGRFGGGEGLVQWLLEQGADVLVSDAAPAETLSPVLDRIEAAVGRRPAVAAGGHARDHFTQRDLVVVNPAVPHPWDNVWLGHGATAGVPCTTAMRLLVERLPDRRRVLGITGSVGKSTTATMMHHILTAAGHDARLGGNIGGSLLVDLHTMTQDTLVVLECSSAQLHWLDRTETWPGWSPGTAVTTNISPNHLDWHGSESHYRSCKAVIEAFQQDGDHALRGDDMASAGTPIALRIPGAHNQLNAALAIEACRVFADVDEATARAALQSFDGLPHRLQPVDSGALPTFWNDAKASTPAATTLALNAFSDRPNRVHLIAGGYDKGVSLDSVAIQAPTLAGLYCIGATGPALAEAARNQGATSVFTCGTLDKAFSSAVSRMAPEDVLLLSPACASWDQYEDFRARGEHFIQLVRSIQSNLAAPTSSLTDATP